MPNEKKIEYKQKFFKYKGKINIEEKEFPDLDFISSKKITWKAKILFSFANFLNINKNYLFKNLKIKLYKHLN